VAGLVETQPVPVSLLVRQYPETGTKSLKYVILKFKSKISNSPFLKTVLIKYRRSPLPFPLDVQAFVFKSHVIIFRSACLKN
jgi:hypothetical protein